MTTVKYRDEYVRKLFMPFKNIFETLKSYPIISNNSEAVATLRMSDICLTGLCKGMPNFS